MADRVWDICFERKPLAKSEITVTIARRELRKWLRESQEGKTVETAVGGLLGGK